METLFVIQTYPYNQPSNYSEKNYKVCHKIQIRESYQLQLDEKMCLASIRVSTRLWAHSLSRNVKSDEDTPVSPLFECTVNENQYAYNLIFLFCVGLGLGSF